MTGGGTVTGGGGLTGWAAAAGFAFPESNFRPSKVTRLVMK